MAKFCTFCGKPLAEGEVCACTRPAPSAPSYDYREAPSYDYREAPAPRPRPRPSYDSTAAAYRSAPPRARAPRGGEKNFIQSMRIRMGLSDDVEGRPNPYEKGKNIVPDCVSPMEGEVPVKQYSVATMKNRIMMIPYSKARGRVQVTSKRMIFRGAGSTWKGYNQTQKEFNIKDIAGVDVRKENKFSLWYFLFGSNVFAAAGALVAALIIMLFTNLMVDYTSREGTFAALGIIFMIFGAGSLVPFFLLKKWWGLKLISSGASFYFMWVSAEMMGVVHEVLFWFFLIFVLVTAAINIFTLVLYSIVPNMVIKVKSMTGEEAVCVERRTITALFGTAAKDSSGYAEIVAGKDYETFASEINAVINDIQNYGDAGVQKWRA